MLSLSVIEQHGRAGLLFDPLQHVDQHLGCVPIGGGRFVDQLGDHRLRLGRCCADRHLSVVANAGAISVATKAPAGFLPRGPHGLPD
jgi:hypothetical protein